MLTRRAALFAMAATTFNTAVAKQVMGQPYPSRPVRIVVAQAPGGPAEFVMRLVAERLSSALGQSVIIENWPGGAGGIIGSKMVASSEPDGHTLLWSYPGPLTTAPLIYKNLDYDPTKSLAPVAAIFSSPFLLGVNAAVPAKSVQEFVTYLKANPGRTSYASAGPGTLPHLLGELLKSTTGVDILHVPFRGGGQAVQAVVAGQAQMLFDLTTSLLPQIEAGTLRALAVTDDTRISQLPEVPTTAEAGFPAIQGAFWTGIVAPVRTPAAIVVRLNSAINDILKTKELGTSLAKLSARPKVGSPEDFAAFMAAETQKWAPVIKAANISVD